MTKTRLPKALSLLARPEPICLLPGPVALAPAVVHAFHQPVIYHRADEFVPLFQRVRQKLAALVGQKPVGLFVGSGTLGNDAVAATLAADPHAANGLVLVSGEFGGRLLKQAQRFGLTPRVLRWDWGQPWQLDAVERVLAAMPPGGWVWGAHHETSTGVQNDLPGLIQLARRYGQRVCVDCVSSLGTVPVDLRDVYLATGASGKAIGSYSGIAFVFANPDDLRHLDPQRIPTYLDVAATIRSDGPRFTIPSPLIAALDAALEVFATPEKQAERFLQIQRTGAYLRARLTEAGYNPLADAAIANPSIVTFAPRPGQTAAAFVRMCHEWGYQIAGQSGYLAERQLVQIAVMGHVTRADLQPLLDRLAMS